MQVGVDEFDVMEAKRYYNFFSVIFVPSNFLCFSYLNKAIKSRDSKMNLNPHLHFIKFLYI